MTEQPLESKYIFTSEECIKNACDNMQRAQRMFIDDGGATTLANIATGWATLALAIMEDER